MESSRRLVLAASIGIVVIVLAGASDFVFGSFWSAHAMLTSLLASLIVLGVTVAVLNEWLDRRDRRRWSVLAQHVLFQLVQAARVTWTSLVELLERREIEPPSTDELIAAARRALDATAISVLIRELLTDAERRRLLQKVVAALAEHSGSVVVSWASVMVGSGPYTDLFDRHVELQGRLDWLNEFLSQGDIAEDRTLREEKLSRSSVASEHADRLGSDDWLHDQILATIQLAVRLDSRSRELAFRIVPTEWWESRTAAAVSSLSG
jgi:hypothetical protein